MPNARWVHCFLHEEALARKSLPCVTKNVIEIVNSIKGKALQTCIFRTICEVGALYVNLFLSHKGKMVFEG